MHGPLLLPSLPAFFCVCVKLRASQCPYLHLSTGVVPLATYMRIYKKGDIVDIKVLSTMQYN